MMKIKKYTVVFAPEAVQEIKDIVKWYSAQQKGLGKKFKANLKKSLDIAKQNPLAYTVRYDDVRFFVPAKFPYAAHFTIDTEERKMIVYAVLAFKQNPETNWVKRPSKKSK